MPQEQPDIQIYSDDVQDIFGKMPHWLIQWGITVIAISTLLILIGTWFIQYPDVIQAQITVTSQVPPVSVVTRTQGNLNLFVQEGDRIAGNEVVGHVRNTANYTDMVFLEELIEQIIIDEDLSVTVSGIDQVINTKRLRLGQIQSSYEVFVGSARSLSLFHSLGSYEKQMKQLAMRIKSYEALSGELERQKSVLLEELELSKDRFSADSVLYSTEFISLNDFNNSKQTYLQRKRALENANVSMINNEIVIRDLQSQVSDISLQQKERSHQLLTGLEESLNILRSQIDSWKEQYVLRSPTEGVVTFLDYKTENQFVQANEEILTVVPQKENVFGLVRMPVVGSGKVEEGQSVHISLANYPMEEFGMVKGAIRRISLVPNQDTYLIYVDLPDGLLTSYNNTLEFKQEMSGTAEIITEDLRLLERIFYQFKNLIDKAV